MPEFHLVPDEGLRARLDVYEARLLRELVAEMKTVLEADIPQQDAVMARLFPDGYEDPEDAQRYRELVQDDLRKHKAEALRTVSERLGTRGKLVSSIPFEELDAWLSVITDIRLAIGTRLDVTEEMMAAEPPPESPDTPALSVLHWLGWLQETMLQAIDGGEDAETETR